MQSLLHTCTAICDVTCGPPAAAPALSMHASTSSCRRRHGNAQTQALAGGRTCRQDTHHRTSSSRVALRRFPMDDVSPTIITPPHPTPQVILAREYLKDVNITPEQVRDRLPRPAAAPRQGTAGQGATLPRARSGRLRSKCTTRGKTRAAGGGGGGAGGSNPQPPQPRHHALAEQRRRIVKRPALHPHPPHTTPPPPGLGPWHDVMMS